MYHSKQLPEKFLECLTEMFGVSLFREIEKTFVERPTTFRVNTLKSPARHASLQGVAGRPHHIITASLGEKGFKIRQIPWYKDAFVLLNKSKRELTDLDIYNEGKIYVQSLASMIPPLALDPQPGEKILDLTAAPGSKTSQIAALMQCRGELVANDNNKVRFFKLKHNMEVLGVVSHCEDPAMAGDEAIQNGHWIAALPSVARNDRWGFSLRMEYSSSLCREYPGYFDKILLDAPCSAEARFIDGEPKTFGYWKEQKIKEMAYKQWGLLLAAWSALKPGGILVYSTCTFAPEENELQITKFLERVSNTTARDLTPPPLLQGEGTKNCVEILDINLPEIKRLPIVKEFKNKTINPEVVKKAMRIMPTKEIEGFFVCKMRKVERIS